jgi:hypothetical protein
MKKGLASKFAQFESDSRRRQLAHNEHQTWAKPRNVNRMPAQELDHKFRGTEYQSQLNDVSQLSHQQYRDATSYQQHEQQQRMVGRMGQSNIEKFEYTQPAMMEEETQIQFHALPKQQQMEELMKKQILHVIGKHHWDKAHIQSWMSMLMLKIEEILDNYLKDGVYKYCIDVLIIKSTAIARQSEMLKSPKTDYSFNLKIKNGHGLTVVVNTHAFRVG